jgi:hypothetical protein
MLTFENGKKYIGVSENKNPDMRFYQHKYNSKNGRLPVNLAWKKYGQPKIEVLETLFGDALYKAEIQAILKNNCICPNGYNILEGGQKSPSLNPDVAKKISIATKKRYLDPKQKQAASDLMRSRSDETKRKIALALTGKKLSDQTKQKIRDANIGKKHDEATKAKMSNSHKGKKYSPETIEKMRKAAKKRMLSPEAKAQLKAASIAGGDATKFKAKKDPAFNGGVKYSTGETKHDDTRTRSNNHQFN